jgi:hypothetical protein
MAGHRGTIQPDVIDRGVDGVAVGRANANLGCLAGDRFGAAGGERAAKRGVATRQIPFQHARPAAAALADADAVERIGAQRRAAADRGRADGIFQCQRAIGVQRQRAHGGRAVAKLHQPRAGWEAGGVQIEREIQVVGAGEALGQVAGGIVRDGRALGLLQRRDGLEIDRGDDTIYASGRIQQPVITNICRWLRAYIHRFD